MLTFISTQLSPSMINIPIDSYSTKYRKIEIKEAKELFKYIREDEFKVVINDFGVRRYLWLFLLSFNKNLSYNKDIDSFQKNKYVYDHEDEVYIFRMNEKLPTWKIKNSNYVDYDIIEIWKLEHIEVE